MSAFQEQVGGDHYVNMAILITSEYIRSMPAQASSGKYKPIVYYNRDGDIFEVWLEDVPCYAAS